MDYVTKTCNHVPYLYHEERDEEIVEVYNVELITGGSCKYNCHSYAWHSQSVSNTYWINNPAPYMEDSGYTKVMCTLSGSSLSANRGDIVFYGTTSWVGLNSAHSAILVSDRTGAPLATRLVCSKWGNNGVFRHMVCVVPEGYDTSTVTTWHRN